MKKYLFSVLLLLTLGLTSCTPKPSSSTSSDPSSPSSESNNSTPSSEPNVDYWPCAQISAYLESYDIDLTIPGLKVTTEVIVELIDDDPDYDEPYLYIFVAGANRESEYTTILEAANYTVEYYIDAYFAVDPDELVEIQFEYFPGDAEYEAGMDIFISALLADDDDDNDLDGAFVSGWPSGHISDYLSRYGLETLIVPALSDIVDVYVEYFDDGEFGPYLLVYILDGNFSEAYALLLEDAGYFIQADDVGYDAYDATFSLGIRVDAFDEDDDFGGTIIVITSFVEAENNVVPSNPDNNAQFDFTNTNQITGAKNALETSWTADGATMVVNKNNSTVNVGNENPSKPEGFWHDPLRLYDAQKITFNAPAGEEIEHVVFVTHRYWNNYDSVTALESAAPNNAMITINNDTITYSFNEPVSTFSFVLSSPARLYSTTLYFI